MKTITGGQEWTFELIEDTFNNIERIAKEKYKLNVYPNQIEIITSEQMLDAYAAVGMPIYYDHWSFGKQFVEEHEAYKRGRMGLAYEIVINSSPCISYLMEENTMLMQALVMAHACFGHNFFFKNNYLFRQWTEADEIINYLVYAKKFISQCEERYGFEEVEGVLDACHALSNYGVDKYKRPKKLSYQESENRRKERDQFIQTNLNELWNTIPKESKRVSIEKEDHFPKEPQENILRFIEENAPRLEDWKREIIRIVSSISQYFYPQSQTKLMNEGCATYFHYKLIHDLNAEGLIDQGGMLEFYESHTNVVRQPDMASINPYALGFAMFKDIERIATNPTQEDKEWFSHQDWVGNNDPIGTIKWAVESFKDESFIQQFLSPKIIREFRLFSIHDDEVDPMLEIDAIHNDKGYKKVRETLSRQYNRAFYVPDIQVSNVDRWGDRSLTLQHYIDNGRPLHQDDTLEVLKHIAHLWGYDVSIESVDGEGKVKAEFSVVGNETLLDVFIDDD